MFFSIIVKHILKMLTDNVLAENYKVNESKDYIKTRYLSIFSGAT
jgi:hypothetical protein